MGNVRASNEVWPKDEDLLLWLDITARGNGRRPKSPSSRLIKKVDQDFASLEHSGASALSIVECSSTVG
jgi:hypothetical protein